MKKRPDEDEAVELLTWDPSDGTDEDEEDFDDELPADENFEGDEDAEGDEALPEDEAEPLAAAADDYGTEKPPELPQPDRARSHPTLPRVKSSSFKRILR